MPSILRRFALACLALLTLTGSASYDREPLAPPRQPLPPFAGCFSAMTLEMTLAAHVAEGVAVGDPFGVLLRLPPNFTSA